MAAPERIPTKVHTDILLVQITKKVVPSSNNKYYNIFLKNDRKVN